MGPAWLTLRADMRLRWRATLGMVLLIGVISGVVLSAAAGARRTDTAYPRMLRWANAAQLFIVPGLHGLTTNGTGRTGYYTAVGRLPQVASMATVTLLGMAVSVRHGPPDQNANTAASLNGTFGLSVDRVRVLAGHRYDPADPDEVMIDPQMAALAHVAPGGTLHVLGIPGFTSANPDLAHEVPLAVRVSAIVRFDDEIVPGSAGSAEPHALFTPAFVRHYTRPYPWLATSDYAEIQLRPGASTASFTRAAQALAHRYPATGGTAAVSSVTGSDATAERAMRPDAVALAIFAALAGIVALAILTQLLGRQMTLDAVEFPILRALGMDRAALAVVALARVGAVTFAGALLGAVIAIAASPLMPIGPARIAEPSPGIEVNLAVLGAGLAATTLLPVLLLLPVAWRAAAAAQGPLGVAEPAAPWRAARLITALSMAGSVTGGIGARMALEPGHGRTAVPVRSALAGTVVAVAAVVAAMVFGASLLGLLSTPHRYGQNWTQKADFMAPSAPMQLFTRVMAAQRGVLGYAAGDYGQIAVDGRQVPAIGIDAGRGHGFLTLLAGRAPAGPGEIALGQHTLRALHARIGQRVRVSANGRDQQARIVGEAVLASFTEGGSDATDLGDGAVIGTSLLSTPYPPTGCVHMTCYSFLLIRYAPGIPLRAADARLDATIRSLSHGKCQLSTGCYVLTANQQPSDVKYDASARYTPLALGALLAMLAAGTLSHALLAGVRRRYRELALLKTLGLLRGQLLRVVFWEAGILAGAALLAGLPLGLLAGRWAWVIFASTAGVATRADVPVPLVLLAIPVTLLLAALIAAGPGWTAARVPAATVLRSE